MSGHVDTCDLTGCRCGGVSDLSTLARCGPATAGLLDRLSTPSPAPEKPVAALTEREAAGYDALGELQARADGLGGLRLRVYDDDGRMLGALYHRLSDAVEACVGQPGRRTVYRETQDGDLLLLCRVTGRGGA